MLMQAREIFNKNYWLTYGEPLQRMREFGTNLKEIDLLDENRLSSEQMKAIITMMYVVLDSPFIYFRHLYN